MTDKTCGGCNDCKECACKRSVLERLRLADAPSFDPHLLNDAANEIERLEWNIASILRVVDAKEEKIFSLVSERAELVRAALEAAINVIPGGSTCNPQQVADAIRDIDPESVKVMK